MILRIGMQKAGLGIGVRGLGSVLNKARLIPLVFEFQSLLLVLEFQSSILIIKAVIFFIAPN